MKIVVLLKQVPSSESSLRLDPNKNWIQEDNITFAVNESDSYALEEALQIREKLGDSEIIVISLGPERASRTIREGLSKGADRGIHIVESFPYTSDPFEAASVLATVLKDENFDLILTGLQSDDIGTGQTGVILGEMLGMSTATLVMETELNGNDLRVKRELESGWFQWLSMKLPSCITIQSGINTPRYPSLKGIMGAKKKEIKNVSKEELTAKGALQSIKKVYIPQKTKRTEMIEGDTDQVADQLTEILKRDIRVL